MATGRVDRKPDPRKNIVGLNLTPKPVGEIWHPNLSGFGFRFGCPSGFINMFLSGFEFFRGFSDFFRVLGFFQVSRFF
jgi:hypothetical protein